MKLNYLIPLSLILNVFIYSQNYYTLKGNVLDAATGEKIIGANVLIKDLNSGVQTDVNGNFIIENLPEGKHLLKVSYIGYPTYEDTVTLNSEDKSIFVSISIRPPSIILKPEIEDYQTVYRSLPKKIVC